MLIKVTIYLSVLLYLRDSNKGQSNIHPNIHFVMSVRFVFKRLNKEIVKNVLYMYRRIIKTSGRPLVEIQQELTLM